MMFRKQRNKSEDILNSILPLGTLLPLINTFFRKKTKHKHIYESGHTMENCGVHVSSTPATRESDHLRIVWINSFKFNKHVRLHLSCSRGTLCTVFRYVISFLNSQHNIEYSRPTHSTSHDQLSEKMLLLRVLMKSMTIAAYQTLYEQHCI